MAEFNIEGLLGNVFGGGGNYLDEYLTPEQRAAMQRNSMLAASAALLKAGGESTRRIGIGEALGSAFEAGQAGYEKAQTGALTQMALKQKLDEAKRAAELRKRIAGVFTPQTAMPGAAPAAMQPAAPMPKVGDPYLRRSIIDNPERREDQVPMDQMQQMYTTQADLDALKNYKGSTVQLPPDLTAPTAAPTAQGMPAPMNPNAAKANQYLQVAKMLEDDGQLEKAMQYQKFAMDLMQPPKTAGDPFRGKDGKTYIRTERGDVIPFNMEMAPKPVGQPQAVMKGGKPVLIQRYDDDSERIISDQQPYEPLPPDIRSVEYLRGGTLAGTGQPGINQVGDYRRTLAPRTDVRVGGPILENAEQKGMGEFNIKNFGEANTQAALAQKTLPSLEIQSQILNKGFTTGFGTEVQKAGASVLAALGVPEAAKFATDAQTFLAATQQAVLQKQLEQKGPQTEADSKRVTQTGAQLGNTVAANQFLIDVAREQLKRDIERKTFLENWWGTKQTLAGADNAWYTGAGGQSLFDRPGLKKYAAPAKAPSAGGFKYLGRESK
jgi:hypothetical protein